MRQTDPTLARSNQPRHMIVEGRISNPIIRLRPIVDTDRFEPFYWSNVKGRWTTFATWGA
jgi:hypothetical protein